MFGIFLIIALIPIVEVMVLIRMGQAIGFWNTVLTLILIGVVGSFVARVEGLRAVVNIQRALERGEPPAWPMIDGLLVFLAGVFLVIPGFLSDVVALALLLPPTRQLIKAWIRSRIERALRRSRETGGGFEYRFLIR